VPRDLGSLGTRDAHADLGLANVPERVHAGAWSSVDPSKVSSITTALAVIGRANKAAARTAYNILFVFILLPPKKGLII
jgi:hypothetical protein